MTSTAPAHHGRIRKPAASRRAHLVAAAILWTAAGAGLLTAGALWIASARAAVAVPSLAAALAAGVLKGRFVLDGAALRIAARIEARGDGRCLGGFLSWRSWLLVALMVAFGRVLRASPLPVPLRGAIYAAIGAGLLVASARFWHRVARAHDDA